MNFKSLILTAVTFTAVSSTGLRAQGFSDDFSTGQGFVGSGASLTGNATNAAKGWTTNDPYNAGPAERGDTSFLQYIPGTTPGTSGAGNNSALFGGVYSAAGYYAGNANPQLFRTFTPVVTTVPNPFVRFQSNFVIQNSLDGSFPNRDIFGFDIRNGGGTSIAKFSFNPGTASPVTPAIGGTALRFQWERNGTIQTTGGSGLTANWDVAYAQQYLFQVDMSASTFTARMLTLDSSFNVVSTTTFVSDGAVSTGTSGLDFANLAVTWNLANTTTSLDAYTSQGSNFIILNNVSAAAVPEPSTIALAVLGLVGFLAYRRTRKTA